MRKFGFMIAMMFVVAIVGNFAMAADEAKAADGKYVIDVYPLLPAKGLGWAKLAKLPENVLLRSGDIVITKDDFKAGLGSLPGMIKDQCAADPYFGLEIVAMPRLLISEAQKFYAAQGVQAPAGEQLIKQYIATLVAKLNIKVTDDEIKALMKEQGVAPEKLEEVRKQATDIITQRKAGNETWKMWAETGKRINIEVSEEWVKECSTNMKESVVDKARKSGKPAIVAFLSGLSRNKAVKEQMTALLTKCAKDNEGKIEILNLDLMGNAVLAMRFGISFGNSGVVFFDKSGKETARVFGVMSEEAFKEEIAKILK